VKRIYSAVAFLLFPACLLAQMADSAFSAYRQTVAGVSFKMVPVPGGNFKMGSRDGVKNESPQRQLSISPFWMGACEVTFDEYDAFMQDEALSQNDKLDAVTRPSQPYIDMTLGMGKEGGYPANSMQPHGALMYCRWLYLKTGVFYRLPTEAEWEYACRAGSSSAYPFGEDKKDLAGMPGTPKTAKAGIIKSDSYCPTPGDCTICWAMWPSGPSTLMMRLFCQILRMAPGTLW
jgi:formylglycine-generating enzyme required for sulfatase activity